MQQQSSEIVLHFQCQLFGQRPVHIEGIIKKNGFCSSGTIHTVCLKHMMDNDGHTGAIAAFRMFEIV